MNIQISKPMLLKLYVAFLFFIIPLSNMKAQSVFKQEKHRFFNFIAGFQSMPGATRLNDRLTSNNFTNVLTPHFIFGIEYGGVRKKNLVKMKFSSTGLFVGKNSQHSRIRTNSISFKYGRDILSKAERTYLYPFVGYNLFTYNLLGNSPDGKKLNATKIDFDFVTGIGLKHFFKKDLLGLFNNIDLNAGISMPVITGRWRQKGSEYLVGLYKLESVFDFTASIGF